MESSFFLLPPETGNSIAGLPSIGSALARLGFGAGLASSCWARLRLSASIRLMTFDASATG